MRASTASGLHALGDLPWGSHVCQFYRDAADLRETLVPFLRAGLEQNEQCLWVTSAPLPAAEARAALVAAVPDLAGRLEAGQIEILDHAAWYERAGATDTTGALRGWVRREADALRRGYSGLRLTGNTAWLAQAGWPSFMDYEAQAAAAFAPRRIVALCSYSVERCGAEDVLDVLRRHDVALARRSGGWESLEGAAQAAARAELARANAELEERVRRRTAALEAALRARDEFLSVASHELRTPLTALQLALAAILRARERGCARPEDEGRRFARAFEQGQRLAVLADELLDVARARAGELALSPAALDASALARDVAERLAEQLARSGCALSVDAPAPVPGRWDPRRLEQVLVNLLANAARHAPGAPVEVAVKAAADGGALLAVRDHGPGVPPEARTRVFEPFARLDPSHGGGLGLGLWIVRQIVEAHGGAVSLGETPGGGAAFLVSLPPTPARARCVAVVTDAASGARA